MTRNSAPKGAVQVSPTKPNPTASFDAQLAATEIVRRCERKVGQLVRQGQEEGAIRKQGDVRHQGDTASAREFFADNHKERTDSYAMADVPDEDFDAAVDEAKEEGNLSRANVVRKGQSSPSQSVSAISRFANAGISQEYAEQAIKDFQAATKRQRMSDNAVRDLLGDRSQAGAARLNEDDPEQWNESQWENQPGGLVEWCTARWAELGLYPESSPAELWRQLTRPARQGLVWRFANHPGARNAFDDGSILVASCDEETLRLWASMVRPAEDDDR